MAQGEIRTRTPHGATPAAAPSAHSLADASGAAGFADIEIGGCAPDTPASDQECPGRDSNSHASRRHPLKMVCLPVPPPGLCGCGVLAKRLIGRKSGGRLACQGRSWRALGADPGRPRLPGALRLLTARRALPIGHERRSRDAPPEVPRRRASGRLPGLRRSTRRPLQPDERARRVLRLSCRHDARPRARRRWAPGGTAAGGQRLVLGCVMLAQAGAGSGPAAAPSAPQLASRASRRLRRR